MAGYLGAATHGVALGIHPSGTPCLLPDPQIRFDYEIAMGVRFGEKQWQGVLDNWIGAHQARIDEILSELSRAAARCQRQGQVSPRGEHV